MYYSAGTYESFAHPEKPKDVDKKSAYIIGTGLAGLTAAFYLVRDGQMKGEHIHLLEKLELAGGSCDGRKDVTKGFFMRGGREMDNHFEVMWDTFRDVPSIETPGVSVLDEYYWLNKHDPNYSLCRATVNCGEDAHTDKKFLLDKDSAMALSKLFLTQEKDLEDKKISDVLPESFWSTNFWLYWQTMFAFQRWSSALEMKRYLCRYVHHIDGLPDFSALRFTKYNQYESMILPLVKYLENHGVQIEYGMDVKNVIIQTEGDKKIAKQIVYVKDGKERLGKIPSINLGERLTRFKRSELDLLFHYRRDLKNAPVVKGKKLYSLEPEDCYTIGEICEKYQLDDSSVWAHVRKYSIPSRQIGNYVYVPKDECPTLEGTIKRT